MAPSSKPSIELQPMSEEAYQSYYQVSIADYAQQIAAAGNVSKQEALKASEDQFSQLLPQGLLTEGQHMMAIWDLERELVVGKVWVGERPRGETRQAVIYDIRVDEDLRGRGYGTQTLKAVEELVRTLGLTEIWLHVFGHNVGARRLYERFGYKITNLTMRKSLKS